MLEKLVKIKNVYIFKKGASGNYRNYRNIPRYFFFELLRGIEQVRDMCV